MQLKSKIFLSVFVISSLMSPNLIGQSRALFVTDNSEGPSLIITAGEYKIRFAELTSWSFRETFYKGKKLFVSSGAHQPALKETNIPKGGDVFLGTGHRKEKIELLELIISDKSGAEISKHPIEAGLEIIKGDMFTVHKKSKFISEYHGLFYDHDAKVTISPDGIKEEYHFKVTGDDLSSVKSMFIFMHIFPKTMKYWIAGDDTTEIERGEFVSDNSFSLCKDIRFALLYDPMQNLGITLIYPEIYQGTPGTKNAFWNRVHDNKLYFSIDPKRNKGESFSYSIAIRAFEAEEKGWGEKGNSIIDTLMGSHIKLNQNTTSK